MKRKKAKKKNYKENIIKIARTCCLSYVAAFVNAIVR